MIFLLYLVNVMDYTNCFLNIKPALHIWNKFYLVMVYHSFYTLLGCILLDFCIHVHERQWSVVFLSRNFSIRLMLASCKKLESIPFSSISGVDYKELA